MKENDYITISRSEYERLLKKDMEREVELDKLTPDEIDKLRSLLEERDASVDTKDNTPSLLPEGEDTPPTPPSPSPESEASDAEMPPLEASADTEAPAPKVKRKKKMPARELKDISSDDAVRGIMGDFGLGGEAPRRS